MKNLKQIFGFYCNSCTISYLFLIFNYIVFVMQLLKFSDFLKCLTTVFCKYLNSKHLLSYSMNDHFHLKTCTLWNSCELTLKLSKFLFFIEKFTRIKWMLLLQYNLYEYKLRNLFIFTLTPSKDSFFIRKIAFLINARSFPL